MNRIMPPDRPSGAAEATGFAALVARARRASATLARAPSEAKSAALALAARAIRAEADAILAANAQDLAAAREAGRPASFLDRLALSPARIEAVAQGVDEIAALPDPVGRELATWTRPNGLRITRQTVPIGVIGMVFESRPNVAADAGAIAVKSGNAILLRGGSDSLASSVAIGRAVSRGLAEGGLDPDAVQVIETADRALVGAMLAGGPDSVDLVIPRGGKGLVERVLAEARVPVLAHAEGLCTTYLHASADPAMALAIVANAKMRRTGICGATETLLVDRSVAASLLPPIAAELQRLGCALRCDAGARALLPGTLAAEPGDFDREWLDAVLSVALVNGVEEAVAHIRRHGSAHTEAIVATDEAAIETFLAGLDSAVVMVNASTQFCDGGEFGFGAEIGIATGRLHARGPVGPDQLVTYRYVVRGMGQVRS